jgi:twitching motility protein PilT
VETDELNRLIRSLNQRQGDEGRAEPSMELVGDESPEDGEGPPPSARPIHELPRAVVALLLEAARRGATDLLLVPDAPPVVRRGGRLEACSPSTVEVSSDVEPQGLLAASLGPDARRRLAREGSVDFSVTVPNVGRVRVNLHRTRQGPAAALRILPRRIPTLTELGLPETLHDLTRAARGLVLVTGATGAGKTTTLAALLDRIVRGEPRHVITIEDPVEFTHPSARAVVEQIEVGPDAPTFHAALVSVLRQDPDVILVGEMRELETTRTVLTAAETGHLVLTTLHTNDVAQTVHRIVDLFPAEQQSQIRSQLSLALTAVICQQLVPRKDGKGRVAAVEILLATNAVRNHIRRGSFHQLQGELTLGRQAGMRSMEESLAELVRSGVVAEGEARLRTSHPDELEALLR